MERERQQIIKKKSKKQLNFFHIKKVKAELLRLTFLS